MVNARMYNMDHIKAIKKKQNTDKKNNMHEHWRQRNMVREDIGVPWWSCRCCSSKILVFDPFFTGARR